jgi:hypothetical protein
MYTHTHTSTVDAAARAATIVIFPVSCYVVCMYMHGFLLRMLCVCVYIYIHTYMDSSYVFCIYMDGFSLRMLHVHGCILTTYSACMWMDQMTVISRAHSVEKLPAETCMYPCIRIPHFSPEKTCPARVVERLLSHACIAARFIQVPKHSRAHLSGHSVLHARAYAIQHTKRGSQFFVFVRIPTVDCHKQICTAYLELRQYLSTPVSPGSSLGNFTPFCDILGMYHEVLKARTKRNTNHLKAFNTKACGCLQKTVSTTR